MKDEVLKKLKTLDVQVDEKSGRVLVSVELEARIRRERAISINAGNIREWLMKERNIEVGSLISGQGIHNNMSRRLGVRTTADLRSDFLFEPKTPVEQPPTPKVAKPKPKVKVAAKPKAKVVAKPPIESVEPEAKVITAVKKESPKPKASTSTSRTKSTRTRSTRTKKVDK